jgi:hypothetical protein
LDGCWSFVAKRRACVAERVNDSLTYYQSPQLNLNLVRLQTRSLKVFGASAASVLSCDAAFDTSGSEELDVAEVRSNEAFLWIAAGASPPTFLLLTEDIVLIGY